MLKRLWCGGLVLALVYLLGACGGAGAPGAGGGGGGGGATPGGVQDMGSARELVKNGLVPPPEAFTVEGMFSEHDLPLEGEACTRLLCLRGALGVAPTLAGDAAAWYQVGLSSSIDLETYERPPLSLVFVVDVSGSMDWEYQTAYSEYQTPLKVAQALLEKLVPTLSAADEVGIVVYGTSARTVLPLTPGGAQDTLLSSVRGLKSEGATNMEAGLQAAYRLVQSAKPGHEKRLLLFTDVQPNVGATGATEFQNLVREGASGGVGLTVFGVGVGLGPETFSALSKVRGGNAFTLFGNRDVDKVLAEDWPFLASPIAYDLRFTVTPSPGLAVAEGYGFPNADTTDDTAERKATLNSSTVFLSKRRGALLVRLALPELAPFSVIGDLGYQTPSGEPVQDSLSASYNGAPLTRGRYFAQPSVAKTVALAVLVSNMQKAAALYPNDREQAVTLMAQTAERFETDSRNDPDLAPEVQLAERLLELMK